MVVGSWQLLRANYDLQEDQEEEEDFQDRLGLETESEGEPVHGDPSQADVLSDGWSALPTRTSRRQKARLLDFTAAHYCADAERVQGLNFMGFHSWPLLSVV